MTSFSLTQLIPDTPPLQIVNVGAAALPGAVEAYESLVDLGYAHLTGFEADPTEFAKLAASAGKNRSFLPHVIGSGGPARFYQTNYPYTGSLLEPNTALVDHFQNLGSLMKVVATHDVVTKRLDDIAELTEIDFLPLYKDQPLFGDVDKFLRDHGLLLHTFRNSSGRCFRPLTAQGDPSAAINQVLWADAVFVTNFQTVGALSTERLKKLAVLLHDIYRSFDLCLLVIVKSHPIMTP